MTTPPLSRRLRSALFVALRAMFRAMPMSEAHRDVIRSRFLREFPTVRPLPAQGQLASTCERRPRVRADERCIGYVEYSEEPLPDPLPATLVAFYLPQFHTIPENDEWWGKGFTEWRNVTRALPQFEGHLQPRLPGDLGFYDLRNPQVMRDQAKLAKTYGLSAFCFYFYWFGGKTLLEEPLRNWLNDKSIDFQYCLCWANENWTRRWDGRDAEVLIAQKHSPEDDIAFIEHVAEYLRDPRYLRVEGRPMLLLYRPMLLPDPKATAERWRAWCLENGIGEIHLAYVQSFERPGPQDIGFDAAVEFPPNMSASEDVTAYHQLLNPNYTGTIISWRSIATAAMSDPRTCIELHPTVNCGWDNEARRPGQGRSFVYESPEVFRRWLQCAIERCRIPGNHVFVNAWNEWAEGAVLEPDLVRGYAWLSSIRLAVRQAYATPPAPLIVLIHAWYSDVLSELLDRLEGSAHECRIIVTTSHDVEHDIRRVIDARTCRGIHIELVVVDNRGRDILPFLRTASKLFLAGDAIVLKIHTKRSPHRDDGDKWRREMVQSLCPADDPLSYGRQMLRDPTIGLVAPRGHLQPVAPFVGANRDIIEQLSEQIGLRTNSGNFASGSMYWVRLSALEPLLSATLRPSDFECEANQTDGTAAHAIERLITDVVESTGFNVRLTNSEPGTHGYQASARKAPRA